MKKNTKLIETADKIDEKLIEAIKAHRKNYPSTRKDRDFSLAKMAKKAGIQPQVLGYILNDNEKTSKTSTLADVLRNLEA